LINILLSSQEINRWRFWRGNVIVFKFNIISWYLSLRSMGWSGDNEI